MQPKGGDPTMVTSFLRARLFPAVWLSLLTVLAFGAGAESRRTLGAVVFFRVLFSVLLTRYVVPSIYLRLARSSKSPHYVSQLVDKLRRGEPKPASSATDPVPQRPSSAATP